MVHLGAMEAMYDLETAFLRFHPLLREWTDQRLGALLTEGDPSTDADPVEGAVARRFADCVVTYRGYERFATEVIGVDLATWLALHHSGPPLVALLDDLVSLNPTLRARAEADLNEGTTGVAGADVDSLNDAVDVFYEQLHDEWTDTVESSTRYWEGAGDRS